MRYRDGSTILPRLSCPACGYKHDAASPLAGDDHVPTAGSISLCMACGEPAVFTGSEAFGYGLRPATAEERASILAQDDVIKAREVIAFARVVKPDWPRGSKA